MHITERGIANSDCNKGFRASAENREEEEEQVKKGLNLLSARVANIQKYLTPESQIKRIKSL
jgi:hypothetical protein